MSYSTSSSVDINAPRSLVWKAITDPAEVKEWFFGTNLEATWEVGSPIYFRGEWQGKAYEDKGEILSYSPEDSLSYTYWSNMSGTEDAPQNYQTLTYTVTETDGHTHLTIDQANVATQETADHSAENWNAVLKGLKEYVEKKA